MNLPRAVEDGHLRTSDVHVDDAAAIYFLAGEKAKAREVYNVTASTNITLRDVAEAIGDALQIPVRSVSRADAEGVWGPMVDFVQYENRASNRKAVEELGWQPKGIDRLTDIRTGSYRQRAEKLQRSTPG